VSKNRRDCTGRIEKLPYLMTAAFFCHGNPMNAHTDGWTVIGAGHPEQEPSFVSPHIGTFPRDNTTARTIHGSGGFPRDLYEVNYPALPHPQFGAARMLCSTQYSWAISFKSWYSASTHRAWIKSPPRWGGASGIDSLVQMVDESPVVQSAQKTAVTAESSWQPSCSGSGHSARLAGTVRFSLCIVRCRIR
jgi:hypothetical protein